MTPDYTEILLEAVDTVILQRLSELKLDKTITCTIVDASSASDGKYVVTDGSREFDAYCDNTKYREDEQVEVLIPAEGSSTQKTIIGKTNTDKDATPVAYVSPLERIVRVGAAYSSTSIGKIQANDPEIYKVKVAEFKEELEATVAKCDTLCVEASFKTLMQNYQMQKGNYGLLITLTTDQNESYSAILDNRKDMFGNTYGYSAFTRAEQTFALNLKGVINKIEVYLYQMSNFKYHKSDEVDVQNVLVVPGYYNIQVKDINISFGYNVEKIADNTAVIDTTGALDYNNVLQDADLKRHLRLTWYNKDKNNQYLGFTDGAFGSLEEAQDASRSIYHIKWEHDLHNGSWERLNPIENNILKATEPTAIDDDFWSHWRMMEVRTEDKVSLSSENSFIEVAYDGNYGLWQGGLSLQKDKYYTLSCELACAKPDNAGGETVQVSINYGNDITYIETVRLPSANGWVKFSHSVQVPADYSQGYIQFDGVENAGFRLYQPKLEACNNATEIDINVDPIYSENTYRAIIYYKGNVFTSNKLVFTAKTGLDSDTVNALNMALTLNNGNKSQDSYPSYGSDSALINIGDASTNREVYFTYDSDIGGTLEPDVLNGAQAYFYIPNNATMLNGPYDSENASWQYAGTDHQIEGYTVYRKVFIDEFTPPIVNTEENPISYNLLKNTEPKELNGRPGDFSYSQSIYDWEADDNCYAYARISKKSTGRKKTIHQVRKKDAQASVIVIKQRLSGITTNTKYSFSAEIYSRHAARAAVYLLIKDDESGSEQKYLLASIVPAAESWTALQGTLQDSIGGDLTGKSVYLTLESEDSTEIFWYKAVLKKGADIPEWFYAEGEEKEKNELARVFRYRIKEIYNPLATNNKVVLKIVDKNGHSYSTWKTFNFSSLGSSGTNYTLMIEDVVNNKAALYDPDHKKLYDTETDTDAFVWYDYPNNTEAQSFVDSERGYAVKKVSTPIDWLGSTITIETLAANFYRRQDNIGYNGPTTIVYDSAGVNPIYYDGEINLFNLETNEKLNNLTYEFKYYSPADLDRELDSPPSNVEDYPRLVYDAEKTPYPHLAVSKMYLENNDLVVLEIYQNNTLEWRQPLIILQNRYAFSAFNNWDGALKIDSANNMIYSAAMVAGTKRDNQFTGVALGAFSKFDTSTNAYGAAAHGLWGFDAGAQAFGFTADGKAFIGKSGTGRINFDGTNGVIASASWLDNKGDLKGSLDNNATGLKIDLKNGHLSIDAANDNHFYFNNNGLDIKVNKLQMTSGLGGANLLKQTAPSQDDIDKGRFWRSDAWYVNEEDKGKIVATASGDGTNAYFKITNASGQSSVSEYIKQKVDFENHKYYTISGKVKHPNADGKTLTIQVYLYPPGAASNKVKEFTVAYGSSWTSFQELIYINETTEFNGGFITIRGGGSNFELYHLQLEEGTIATTWSSAEEDINTKFEITNNSIALMVEDVGTLDKKYSEIKMSVDGITTTVADLAKATYSGTCSTPSGNQQKAVSLRGVSGSEYSNVFKNDVIISVTFTNGNTNVREIGLNIEGTNLDNSENPSYKYPIWFNGAITKADNPFTFAANSTIFFQFIDNHWLVVDAGSYSQITQTASQIRSEVTDVQTGLQSSITETAGQIRSEVKDVKEGLETSIDETADKIALTAAQIIDTDYRAKENSFQPSTSGGSYVADISITYPINPTTSILQSVHSEGKTIAVQFKTANNYNSQVRLEINADGYNSSPIYYNNVITSASNPFYWAAGETVNFKCTNVVTATDGKKTCQWHVITDSITQLQVKTAGITATKIDRKKNSGFGFYLDEDEFQVGATNSSGVITPTLKITKNLAEFSGKITASSGAISGNLTISGALTHTSGNYTVTTRGVQSDVGKAVFYITDNSGSSATYPFRVNGDGSFVATKATISGTITAKSGTIAGFKIGESDGYQYKQAISKMITATDGNKYEIGLTTHGGSPNNDNVAFYIRRLVEGKTNWKDDSTLRFFVRYDGTVRAQNLELRGGSVGPMNVDSDSIHLGSWTTTAPPTAFMADGSLSRSYTIGGLSSDKWVFGAGTKFGVTNTGSLYCNDGHIGNWHIMPTYLAGRDPYEGEATSPHLTAHGIELWYYDDWTDQAPEKQDWVPWSQLIATVNASAISDSSESDINVKNSIAILDDVYDNLFDNLRPCKYKYNHGTSDRYHTGFIAQDVVDAVESAGLTTQDFAGVVHLEKPNENGCEWLLRRDEFVALNTWQIQKLKQQISDLEYKLNMLEKKE